MLQVKIASTLVVMFRAFLASDHVSVATGKTIAITISKNGGAFGNPNAGATNATEVSSGWYKVTLDTTDTGTAGPLAVRGAVATVDDVAVLFYVGQAPADVTHWLGNGVAAAANGLPKVDVDTIKTNPVVNGGTITLPTNATVASTTNITAAAGCAVSSIGANVITAAATAADFSTEVNAAVLAILGTPAGASLAADIATVAAFIDTEVAAILAKTNLIPGTQDGKTYAQTINLISAVLLGKVSGVDTGSPVFRDMADAANRVSATIDAGNNRTAITLNPA